MRFSESMHIVGLLVSHLFPNKRKLIRNNFFKNLSRYSTCCQKHPKLIAGAWTGE